MVDEEIFRKLFSTSAKIQSEYHYNLNEPEEGCLFCKIIKREIPSTKIYEDELVYAFTDIAPQAPVHVIVVPKIHIESINAITEKNSFAVAYIAQCIPQIAAEQGLTKGYRVVSNVGEHGAQSVKHLHFHILGGEQLSTQIC